MSTFAEHVAEDRRLSLLLLLADSPAYAANEHLLRAALEGFGHLPSTDQVRGDLAWLAEQGLAETSDVAGVSIAKATARGLDVAAGRAVQPGVKRPSP
jgi:hypothetical protein